MRRTQPVVSIVALLLISLLGGCALTGGQRAAISSFGGAAKDLGATTSTQVLKMRESVIRMNTERLVLSGKSSVENDVHTLDRTFNLSNTQTVIGATDALAAYGQALLTLATNDEAAALKTSSDRLVASLSALPNGGGLSQAQATGIGTIVQDVGGIFIEYKRKQAIAAVVIQAGPAVNMLCDLLSKDFGEQGWVSKQLKLTEDLLSAQAESSFMDVKSFSDRRTAVEAIKLADESVLTRKDILGLVVSASSAMKQSNEKLISAMNSGDWSLADVQSFVAAAVALRNAVRVVSG